MTKLATSHSARRCAAVVTLLAALGVFRGPALAGPGLTLELNAATTVGSACRVTMVARNGLDVGLRAFALEVVVFDDAGAVSDFAALDLGALPAGKRRVRQYDISTLACDRLSSLLVNEVRTCDGDGVPPQACLANLATSSRIGIRLEQ